MTVKNPLENLLNLALKMSRKNYEYYECGDSQGEGIAEGLS